MLLQSKSNQVIFTQSLIVWMAIRSLSEQKIVAQYIHSLADSIEWVASFDMGVDRFKQKSVKQQYPDNCSIWTYSADLYRPETYERGVLV